ncbi:MAG: class I SAM-dependent methyltransferase [Acholeplasmataceae bacterium]
MPHYYDDNTDLISQPSEIKTYINKVEYTFTTDHGVFSKSRVDFGTQRLLEAITLDQPKHILDIGCGYGVVGIVMKHTYPNAQVTMFDVNPRAVELAKNNCLSHGLSDIDVFVSDHIPKELNGVDVAILNPPIRAGKDTVFRLYEEAYNILTNQGLLYIVIQKKQGSQSSKVFLEALFDNVVLIQRDKGYHVFKAIKS